MIKIHIIIRGIIKKYFMSSKKWDIQKTFALCARCSLPKEEVQSKCDFS